MEPSVDAIAADPTAPAGRAAGHPDSGARVKAWLAGDGRRGKEDGGEGREELLFICR